MIWRNCLGSFRRADNYYLGWHIASPKTIHPQRLVLSGCMELVLYPMLEQKAFSERAADREKVYNDRRWTQAEGGAAVGFVMSAAQHGTRLGLRPGARLEVAKVV